MPRRPSPVFQRIILVLSALAVLGAAAWVAMRLFEPVLPPPLPPPRARVSFDARADIRRNPLFDTLRGIVTGEIEPGALGRANPFVGPSKASSAGGAGSSGSLGTVEEVPLGGGRATALARGADGALLVLISGKKPDGSSTYEIRAYGADGAVSTFASWQATGDANLTPVVFAQDKTGAVWLGGATGRIGIVTRGQTPVWQVVPGAFEPRAMRRMLTTADGAVWAADGARLFVLAGATEPITFDPASAVLLDEKQSFEERLAALPAAMQPSGRTGPDNQPVKGLDAERLYALADGGIGLVTGYLTLLFSSSLSAAPKVLDTLEVSSLPLAVSPWGDVWARRYTDGALVRAWATGTRAYTDPYAVPRRAIGNPELFASDASRLYALDYSTTSTVLWQTSGESWQAVVAAASGTLPNDTPLAVEADGSGNIWAIMRQGGLLRIRSPKTGL